MQRLLSVMALPFLLSATAYGTEIKIIGSTTLSDYEMKSRVHTTHSVAEHVAETSHRNGFWELQVADLDGKPYAQLFDTVKLAACGGAGIYTEEGGKPLLSQGFFEGANFTFFFLMGQQQMSVEMQKDGLGHYSGTLMSFDSGNEYPAELAFAGNSDGFAVAPVVVNLSGTPTATRDDGGGTVMMHKSQAASQVPGYKFSHGEAAPEVCYQVTAGGGSSVGGFMLETQPMILMTYEGVAANGSAQNLVLIGLTDRATVQAKPRVVSAAMVSSSQAVGMDLFELPVAATSL